MIHHHRIVRCRSATLDMRRQVQWLRGQTIWGAKADIKQTLSVVDQEILSH